MAVDAYGEVEFFHRSERKRADLEIELSEEAARQLQRLVLELARVVRDHDVNDRPVVGG